MADVRIPPELLPADGRFGCGPSKVRADAVQRLAASGGSLLGTSHRQAPVKDMVHRIREGLARFFDLPAGYEVVLGNGGATLFWDAAVHGLIRRRSAHAVFGEFSSKFAAAVAAAPFLEAPVIAESAPGATPQVPDTADADVLALTHCETSTGVALEPLRPAGDDLLVVVDATSAAGGMTFDPTQTDVYYFSPQKCFGSDGGLWLALVSPLAVARIGELAAGERYIPAMLDLQVALGNSRSDQTYNTPALATLALLADQVDWLTERGGLAAAAKDCTAKAEHVYRWAEDSDYAQPFVTDPGARSTVVCTVDLDERVPADAVSAALRANGIVDTEAYRKLGRNQLRLGVFPAVDAGDVERLTAAIDHVAERVATG